jgi:hypothetical protein
MAIWGLFSLVVVAVPLVAVLVWVYREQESSRRRRRFLRRYPQRSVAGIRERVKREREAERLAHADTQVIPAIPPDDVATEPIPQVPPLPRRRRPSIDRRPTPWPQQDPDE